MSCRKPSIPGSSYCNDGTGSPIKTLAPLGVVLFRNNDANPSPGTVLPLAEATESADSIHVDAFQAPYQQTEDNVHLSIPVTPATLQMCVDTNFDNYDDTDADGEIGPFFDSVADEVELDSNDDYSWDDFEPPARSNRNCNHNLKCNINCLQQSRSCCF